MSRSQYDKTGMWVGVIMAMSLLPGCVGGVRAPAREATMGVVDAIVNPDPKNELAVKINHLVDKYVESALKAGPPPGIDRMTQDVAEGLIKAVSAHAPEERALIRALVHDAVTSTIGAVKQEIMPSSAGMRRSGSDLGQGLVDSVTRHEDDILRIMVQSGSAAGRSLTRATSGEIVEQLTTNLEENSPLSQALISSTERTSAALVRGMTMGLTSEMSDCSNRDPALCKDDLVRRMSRSAAMGFTEGVGRKLQIWELALAAVGGVVLALAANWIFRRWVNQASFGDRRVRIGGGVGMRRRVRRGGG